ncbi:MAG: flagellar hook-length control protein FliK [Lachnospiraceae bacterium]|nr:flagellar hook-length control protein FliK [Lachnospiraceae bacterium]
MTSATVTQLGDMMMGISNNIGNMDTQNGEFAGIFQTAAEKSEGTVKEEPMITKTSATENTMNVSKKADELNQTQTEVQKTEPEDVNAVEKELESAAEELKTEIAEKLDITVEELEAVMETLGLTNASLFTQEGMTALVMEIEQIATPVELLTNADAYQTLQELNTFANELLSNVQEEFQLTDTQMQMAMERFAQTEEEVQMPATEEQTVPVETQETEETQISEPEAVQDVRETDAEEPVVSRKDDSETTDEQMMTDENSTVKETELNKAETGTESKENKQQSGTNSQTVAENSFQQSNTQTVNQTVNDFSQNVNTGNMSTQEIYDQIGEYIKTNIRPGISEVEMQLNPENLGTLHIHLSSKQGNVTAQLTVQNELVKAALEVQLIQLKENFAEQGIKVDAVEVTVESHAFNENMQQSNEENGQAQAQARRTATRSINLNGDWMEEELTEEEQLVAEMMEADGNTVDYKA